MVQFLSINFFLGFLQFLLGFSKVPVFLCQAVYPQILKTGTNNHIHTVATVPIGKQPPVPQEAGWAPEPLWMPWIRKRICLHWGMNSDYLAAKPLP